jgi:hypothetical protein
MIATYAIKEERVYGNRADTGTHAARPILEGKLLNVSIRNADIAGNKDD